MKTRVRRVGARSVFLLLALLYGFVGLAVGLLLALLAGSDLATPEAQTAIDRLGWWSLLVFPAAYGLLGGLAGAIAAVLYNFAAGITGGVRVELGERGRDPSSAGERPEEEVGTGG